MSKKLFFKSSVVILCLIYGLQPLPWSLVFAESNQVSETNPSSDVVLENNISNFAISDSNPEYVLNNFKYFLDGEEITPGKGYDFPTYIKGVYMADDTIVMDSYEMLISNNIVAKIEDASNGFNFDLTNFLDGKYVVTIRANGHSEFYGEQTSETWTFSFWFEIKSTDATVVVHRYYNPTQIDLTYKGDDHDWVIRNETGEIVHSKNGTTSINDYIDSLPEGKYTVENTAKATTIAGTEVPSTTAVGVFEIRHPFSTITLDQSVNPKKMTGTQKIAQSTLTWVIKNKDGGIEEQGTGAEVPLDILLGLEDGEYTGFFIETSPEGEEHESSAVFTIRYPKSTTTVDREYNPSKITGGKKLDDSDLFWEIRDDKGKVLSGEGDNVPDKVLNSLVEGTYEVFFTEKSKEGEESESSGSFTIRHPESTTTVDREYNPNEITGTKKIKESTLTWEIKDSKGDKKGQGDKIGSDVLSNLEEGTYTVEFTETSPEGEESKSSANFTIRHPKSTTTVDKPINPEKITGTKKIGESILTWEIKDDKGEVAASGTGDKVADEELANLKNGNYEVSFTEKSPEGEESKSSASFTIRHPESTTTVNRKYNPSEVTGTKKISDSTLTWELKDANGKVLDLGKGNKILLNSIFGLKEGIYTAEFTETSPEGEESKSSDTFIIRHPESTTKADKKYNPSEVIGTKKIEESTLTWELKDASGKVLDWDEGNKITSGRIDELEEGTYTAEFTETSPEGEKSKSSDTFIIRHPKSTTTVDREYNPSELTGTKKISESELTWEIKDDKGKVVATGQGNKVPDEELAQLENGNYEVGFTEKSPEGEESQSSASFTIRHPKSTTTVDREYNPSEITGTKKIPESELTWEIKDDKGKVVATGQGNKVPDEELAQLENGNYEVGFTEKSPEGEESKSSDSFTIRHPKSTTTVDKPINPGNIVGTKKINESELRWEIKDSAGKTVALGRGNEVPKDILSQLGEGSYKVSFIERSPEEEESESSSTFIVRHPLSTTTVDKSVNPGKITGTKKIPDSDLRWEIKDKDGKVVESGTGNRVPDEILSKLVDGTYKVGFIEKSPEGEESRSEVSFTVSNPVITTFVERTALPVTNVGTSEIVAETHWIVEDAETNAVAVNTDTTETAKSSRMLPNTGSNESIWFIILGCILLSICGVSLQKTKKQSD